MTCPEQRAWGGVLKRSTVLAYGTDTTPLRYVRRLLTAVFVWSTRRSYARLAHRVVRDIDDYRRSGFDVVGIIGIGGSPSCGVHKTLDLARTLAAVAASAPDTLERGAFNDEVIAGNVVAGPGLFIDALTKQLRRRHLTVPLHEHDLIAEMRGEHVVPVEIGTRRSR